MSTQKQTNKARRGGRQARAKISRLRGQQAARMPGDQRKRIGGSWTDFFKNAATIVLLCSLVSCADPAFQQYIQNRQAAIANMPNGPMKYQAQETLDMQILADKRDQQARQAQAAAIIGAGLIGAAAGYNASRPYNVNVYHWGR